MIKNDEQLALAQDQIIIFRKAIQSSELIQSKTSINMQDFYTDVMKSQLKDLEKEVDEYLETKKMNSNTIYNAIYQACLVAAKNMESRIKTISWFGKNKKLK